MKRYFPGEWADMPQGRNAPDPRYSFVPTLKPPPPVHPHTSFGRSTCTGRCYAGCGAPIAHVRRDTGFAVLDCEPVADGAYVLELDEFRKATAVAYDERFHDGWARYGAHVCKEDGNGEG